MQTQSCEVLVVGAGIVGISAAYYLQKLNPLARIVLIDECQPMTFTSAQSGENYRNWWPHPVMSQFTDRSIDLMEELSLASSGRTHLTRRGYVLATRRCDTHSLMSELEYGYSCAAQGSIRIHGDVSSDTYTSPANAAWQGAPEGVDVINNAAFISKQFPSFANDIKTVIHVRRAGSVDSQQMGQFMLESFKEAGGKLILGTVDSIDKTIGFTVCLENKALKINADKLVNAAGPFINTIAGMIDCHLPVTHTLQQKIAFEDRFAAIPRNMPFSIDLDAQYIDWTDEERELLRDDAQYARYAREMPGSIHCRPDGGDNGKWVKLGWAFNSDTSTPQRDSILNAEYPDIVLRGAARLNPALKNYYGKLPRNTRHYGGYYTLTDENWPLVGEMDVEGAYIVGAMSGFGTMAACASGELIAQWVYDLEKPEYAEALSPGRYQNEDLMSKVRALSSRGIL